MAQQIEIDQKKATQYSHEIAMNISKAFFGKRFTVQNSVLALLAGGHILLEDVPGVGKTLLAKAIAKSISGVFKRIQFTADLLPSDITGVTVYEQQVGKFKFRKGPIFTNVLIGDEINRATPRTQSSLLEAMEESQITVDGVEYKLAPPFFVIATQNPIELEGTYPLPFSQMDRFITRLNIGYLAINEEINMLKKQRLICPLNELKPIINCELLQKIQQVIHNVEISNQLYEYLTNIINATRTSEKLKYGASPRASIDLMRYSQANAVFNDRNFVLPDDIKRSAPLILSHRVIIEKGTRLSNFANTNLINEIIETVKVPL